jgi:hypothetical protein
MSATAQSVGSDMFDWLGKHLTLLSTGALVFTIVTSILLLASYFSVFDLAPIWLIEYSDITNIFLVVLCLTTSSVGLVVVFGGAFLERDRSKRFIGYVVTMFAMFFAIGITIYKDFKTGSERLYFHSMLTGLCVFFIGIIIFAFEKRRSFYDGSIPIIASFIVLAAGLLTLSGRVYGIYVRDVAPANVMIQTTSKDEPISNAKIIAWFSHHVAIYVNHQVIIIPTADIKRLLLGEQNRPIEEGQENHSGTGKREP